MPTQQEREQCRHGTPLGTAEECGGCASDERAEAERLAPLAARLDALADRILTLENQGRLCDAPTLLGATLPTAVAPATTTEHRVFDLMAALKEALRS